MRHNAPAPALAPKFAQSFYAVINPDNKEILKKCNLKQAAAWGKIIYAEMGVRCVAPVIGGISMPFTYGEATFAIANEMEVDNTPLAVLEARVHKYYPHGELAEPVLPAVRAVPAKPPTQGQAASPGLQPLPVVTKGASAPREGSITRRVWDLADEALGRLGGTDMKAVRAAVTQAAQGEEINPSTVSVQYSKWKASLQHAE